MTTKLTAEFSPTWVINRLSTVKHLAEEFLDDINVEKTTERTGTTNSTSTRTNNVIAGSRLLRVEIIIIITPYPRNTSQWLADSWNILLYAVYQKAVIILCERTDIMDIIIQVIQTKNNSNGASSIVITTKTAMFWQSIYAGVLINLHNPHLLGHVVHAPQFGQGAVFPR